MAMLETMSAIEFNLWMTIIARVRELFEDPVISKLVRVQEDNILPEYPRDLTDFKKPTIIVMRVADDITNLNFLGQAYDPDQNLLYDVTGKYHDTEYQIDVFADNNWQMGLLTSAITDSLFPTNEFVILNWVKNLEDPPVQGTAKVMPEMDVRPLGSNRNNDYRMAIRFYMAAIQTFVPEPDIVDLAKWIKVTQHVRIGGKRHGKQNHR